MDDSTPRKRKPPTPRQQLKNLCDALAEDARNDAGPLTKEEREKTERVKRELLERVESEPLGWEQTEAKRKAAVKPKYIN